MKTDAGRHSIASRVVGSMIALTSDLRSRVSQEKKYYCPMCKDVESDTSGRCARCGMTLERNPAFLQPNKVIYTCPMHPQIQQDHPGNCPICGMTLELKTIGAGHEEEQHEIKLLSRKFWFALALTIPVVIMAMGHAIPGLHVDALVPRQIGKWIEFGLRLRWFFGRAAFSSLEPGSRSSTAVSTCLR